MKHTVRLFLMFLLLPLAACGQERIVNIYGWTGEIPDFVVRDFEKETHIKVNLSTYSNNEIMYAKLRTSAYPDYDLVMPSSYFVDRMSKQHLLAVIDRSKLSNWHNINPAFLNTAFDPKSQYSIPYLWGITGIFYNDTYFPKGSITKWNDLWEQRFENKLLMLDDTRDVFSMALLSLGYSANDTNPEHIRQAFLKLQKLMPNIKVFSSDTVVSIAIDEDATVGLAWSGDAYKISQENKQVQFVFPKEGFVIWVDNFAIPRNAPHREEAYTFLNYILRSDVAEKVALATRYPTANLAAQKRLPSEIRDNPTAYPTKEVMRRGQFQTDVGDDTLALFEKYWEELKMNGT